MVGRFDAIDAPAYQIHKAARPVELAPPLPQRTGVHATMPPRPANLRPAAENHHRIAARRKMQGERNA